MSLSCLCYTVDERYLIPALASAMMVREQESSEALDIVVACFGESTNITRAAGEACAAERLKFSLVPHDVLEGMPMICARFFLDGVLDRAYETVTYLDADTQAVGSLSPLLNCPIQSYGLLAAPDLMALMWDDAGSVWHRRRDYFRSIGISSKLQARYFNSGVIRFRRSDWAAISTDCLALCRSPLGRRFEFADQDALNVVLAGRVSHVSLKWNFPGFFLERGLEDVTDAPRIIHYMSNPRPWDGPFRPWGREGNAPYLRLVQKHPALRSLHHPVRGQRLVRYRLQQLWKRKAYDWGNEKMRSRIATFETQAVV